MKDLRYFRQERASLGNRYPFARAERFNRDVRRLGLAAGERADDAASPTGLPLPRAGSGTSPGTRQPLDAGEVCRRCCC